MKRAGRLPETELPPGEYVARLRNLLEAHADEAYAVEMKAYLRNQFEFFGMRSPERKVIFNDFIGRHGIPGIDGLRDVADILFEEEEREFQYFGIEAAGLLKKSWTPESIDLFESMAVRKSWWDSVDYIKSACLRDYFLRFTELRGEITERWIDSGNIWLQRLSVIFQLGYRDRTDRDLLERNITRLADSSEFFVQKAIGWALRDYARTDPEFVLRFVDRNKLKPLSRREALKRLDRA